MDEEKDLLGQLAAGNEKAFHEVYHQYQRRIFSFAYLLTESADLAEEVVQEIFIKLWYNRGKLGNVANFSAWLHAMTRNFVADAMKKRAREILGKKELGRITSMESNHTDEIIFLKENEQLLREAIEKLSPQQQVVYKMSREQGLKHAEIAEQLNISDRTVKNHLVNASRIIREYFRANADLIVIISLSVLAR